MQFIWNIKCHSAKMAYLPVKPRTNHKKVYQITKTGGHPGLRTFPAMPAGPAQSMFYQPRPELHGPPARPEIN